MFLKLNHFPLRLAFMWLARGYRCSHKFYEEDGLSVIIVYTCLPLFLIFYQLICLSFAFPCSRVDNLLNSFVNQTKISWFFCATELKTKVLPFACRARDILIIGAKKWFQLDRATRTMDKSLTWQLLEKAKHSASSPF